ncbi:MAG: DUF4390 domain-containing protein [Bilophila sp.]
MQTGTSGQTGVGAMLVSQEPFTLKLRSFSVETVDGGVRVESGLMLEKTAFLRALLRDGAVLNLAGTLTLERLRTLLSNTVLSEITLLYQLRHDPLTREFVLSVAGSPSIRQKNLDDLLAFAWKDMHFLLPLQESLVSGETYRVRLDLTLQHAEVPPWLEKALFFWSWDVAPAASFSHEFVY